MIARLRAAHAAALAAALAGMLAAGAAQAQFRSIPAEAKRGELRHLNDMIVEIDGKAVRLAPGARIRDPDNLIMLPTAIPAGVLIKYTQDAQGMVNQVWILSPTEAARRDPPKPVQPAPVPQPAAPAPASTVAPAAR